jgi:hypothetical protein
MNSGRARIMGAPLGGAVVAHDLGAAVVLPELSSTEGGIFALERLLKEAPELTVRDVRELFQDGCGENPIVFRDAVNQYLDGRGPLGIDQSTWCRIVRYELGELRRLAELYRQAGTTNPCLVIARRQGSPEDRPLLRFVIDSAQASRVSAWRSEVELERTS